MLEIGRALLLAPELILIDEPSMGLARKVTARLFGTLIELRQAGVTVLMVEQNARSALAISDDGIVLEQGRLALAGSAEEFLSDGRVGALVLGGGLGSARNRRSDPAARKASYSTRIPLFPALGDVDAEIFFA